MISTQNLENIKQVLEKVDIALAQGIRIGDIIKAEIEAFNIAGRYKISLEEFLIRIDEPNFQINKWDFGGIYSLSDRKAYAVRQSKAGKRQTSAVLKNKNLKPVIANGAYRLCVDHLDKISDADDDVILRFHFVEEQKGNERKNLSGVLKIEEKVKKTFIETYNKEGINIDLRMLNFINFKGTKVLLRYC